MTDELLNQHDPQAPDEDSWDEVFEQLLDEYEYERPRRGEIVDAEVIRVDEDGILVDIGAKRDALVPRRDLDRLDEEMLEGISRGDKVPVYVLKSPSRYGDELVVSINKGLEQEDWEQAQALMESGEVLELEVVGRNRGGLVVTFGRLRGFLPNSHIPSLRRGASVEQLNQQKEEKIGEKLLLKIIEVDERQRRLILSGRAAQRERRQQRLEQLTVGEVLEGRVVNLVDFGAFIDLGGVDGLVHISELDWQRVDHPSEVVELGELLEVKLIGVDVDRERVSLSRKALLENPWQQLGDSYQQGDLVEGEITNIRDFGAFVMLPEGIEGLIHTSEIGIDGPGEPKDVLRTGDKVLARVIEIDPERERISLSLRRVEKDEQLEWMDSQDEEPPSADEAPDAPVEIEDFDASLEADLQAEAEAREAAEAEAFAEQPSDTEAAEAEAFAEQASDAEAEEPEPVVGEG